MEKIVRIECQGAATANLDQLIPFQGELKTLGRDNYHKLRDEIIRDGFSEPISVWRQVTRTPADLEIGERETIVEMYVLNGHQRLKTLEWMRDEEGYLVPPIPISLVDAPDREAAKRKVLALTSQYGEMTADSLVGFMKENNLSFKDVSSTMRFAEVPLKSIEMAFNVAPEGSGGPGDGGENKPDPATLQDRFLVPPFSVLDARQGYWQARKQKWLALGIKSELGRGANLSDDANPTLGAVAANVEVQIPHFYKKLEQGMTREQIIEEHNAEMRKGARLATPGGGGRPETTAYKSYGKKPGAFGSIGSWENDVAGTGSEALLTAEGRAKQHVDGVLMKSDSGNDPAYYFKKQQVERELGRELTTEEFQRDYYQGPDTYKSGTSIFDPVLCELAYRWFSPVGGFVLDPFAGGSVRGIVASHCGRHYHGIELRAEQVEANRTQVGIAKPDSVPIWDQGDSAEWLPNLEKEFDLVFSCPPYADLEVYSEDPKDISNMPWDKFLATYRYIIQAAVNKLKNDRFAVWVVGEVRDKKKGTYINLVGETIRAFQDAGADYYNEAILVTQLGSLPIRAGRQFSASRALGKTHQNMLVFVKGDRKAAAAACGEIKIEDLFQPEALGEKTEFGEKVTLETLGETGGPQSSDS